MMLGIKLIAGLAKLVMVIKSNDGKFTLDKRIHFFLIISLSSASNASTVWFQDLSFTLDHEVLLLVSRYLSRPFWYIFKCLSSFIDKYDMMESWSIVNISTLNAQSMILVNPFVMPISECVN